MPVSGLNWNGKEIERKLLTASRRGIDVTLASCIAPAKRNTPVVTGTAQGSIQFRPAVIRRRGAEGLWGSFQVDYFIWLEIGARGRSGHFMLRQSADENYPKLARNIQKALASGSAIDIAFIQRAGL